MKLKVFVFTGARSEYGLMRWIMEDLKNDPDIEFSLIVSGSHFAPLFGNTYQEIERDGFTIHHRIPLLNSDHAGAVAEATQKLHQLFKEHKPDLLICLGDRFELLGLVPIAAMHFIPIAHLIGGDVTEGAFDDSIRHAVSKLSHLHFVTNEESRKRLLQLGEEDWRISVAGDPGLDNFFRSLLLTREELSKELDLDLNQKTALVTYHPVTLELNELPQQLEQFFAALAEAPLQYLITYPNSDPGNDLIVKAIHEFATTHTKTAVRVIKNLGQKRYMSALKSVNMMIGNSSSGIYETPTCNLPTVNIGNRQKGRLQAKNLIQTDYNKESILKGIDLALQYDRTAPILKPYGEGNSARTIVNQIKKIFAEKSREELLLKKFQSFVDRVSIS